MPANYDAIDWIYSWNGDIIPDQEGDIADTSKDQIVSLNQDVATIVQSAIGDWEEHPTMSADVDSLVGEPNTRATAKKLEVRIKDALVLYRVASPGDIQVRVVPMTIHSVVIVITIAALATRNNSLERNVSVTTMVFDYQDRGILVLDRSVT